MLNLVVNYHVSRKVKPRLNLKNDFNIRPAIKNLFSLQVCF